MPLLMPSDPPCRLLILKLQSRRNEHSNEQLPQLPKLKLGDKVTPTTEPHLGRTGTVVAVNNYWIEVEADWVIVYKGKENRLFKKPNIT